MPPREHVTGHETPKKKKKLEKRVQSLAGKFGEYVSKVTEFTSIIKVLDEHISLNSVEVTAAKVDAPENLIEVSNASQNEGANADVIKNESVETTLDIYDPANWNEIDQDLRDMLVQMGPITKEPTYDFPINDSGRCFSAKQYAGKLSNGEKYVRKWLVYSCSADKMFCFCCKLFMQDRSKSQLGREGHRDWKNIRQILRYHERSRDHITCMTQWAQLEIRLKKNDMIDKKALKEMISSEEKNAGCGVRVDEARVEDDHTRGEVATVDEAETVEGTDTNGDGNVSGGVIVNVDADGNSNVDANAGQNEDLNANADEIKPLDMYDPANWKMVNKELRDMLVRKGPITNDATFDFPVNDSGRRFAPTLYVSRLSSGEKYIRKWLVYSCLADRVFCFCCKLFRQSPAKYQLTTEGCKDWQNISLKLKKHERSRNHILCMTKWTDLEMRLKKDETIDKSVKEMTSKEREQQIQGRSK